MRIIDSLHIYPIKGCRGIDLLGCTLQPRGIEHDRRWMIVDSNNRFISQRSHPKLAQLQVQISDETLTLSTDNEQLHIDTQEVASERANVTVWSSEVNALLVSSASDFLSSFLAENVALVYMDSQAKRFTSVGGEVSFADGFPLLLTNVASLKDVNLHSETQITMDRFRPNIVISGGEAWEEDFWDELLVGDVKIKAISACARCKVITLDQASGEYKGKEPLRTLSKIHLQNGKATFGINAASEQSGVLQKGMPVTVHSTRESSHLPLD